MIEFNKRWIHKQFRKLLVEPTVCQNCSNMGFNSHLWHCGKLYWSCKECEYMHFPNGCKWEVYGSDSKEEMQITYKGEK